MNDIETICLIAAIAIGIFFLFMIPIVIKDMDDQKEKEQRKTMLPPIERLEIYLKAMKAADRAGVVFKSGGSDLTVLINTIESMCPDIENGIYEKELEQCHIP